MFTYLTDPNDYFLLDAQTGELRTAKPLDREALEDSTGIISLVIRARELVNGVPSDDPLTSATAKATVTIRDVNDSPPVFNHKEYSVSLLENTLPGTPLALDMSVSDADVGINSKFALRLDDVSGVFDVEPKLVTGYSQVNIRVANGTLDYENPNQRKFIVLVVAEETDTNPRLSSTATITVSVLDANDNKPVFEQESYSASVSEAALPGQYIATIGQNPASFFDLPLQPADKVYNLPQCCLLPLFVAGCHQQRYVVIAIIISSCPLPSHHHHHHPHHGCHALTGLCALSAN